MSTATAEKKTKPTAASWKKAKVHEVTLPSGTEVKIEIPNLPILIKTGQIPNHLVGVAAKAAAGTLEVTPELIAEQADFTAKIVSLMVKEPAITEEEVHELPFEDIEMLMGFASREIDLDVLGRHIGGLHTQDEFRKFRNLDLSF